VEDVNGDGFADVVIQSASGTLAYANMDNGVFNGLVNVSDAPGYKVYSTGAGVQASASVAGVTLSDTGTVGGQSVQGLSIFDPGTSGGHSVAGVSMSGLSIFDPATPNASNISGVTLGTSANWLMEGAQNGSTPTNGAAQVPGTSGYGGNPAPIVTADNLQNLLHSGRSG
jgi:hypothetical protein